MIFVASLKVLQVLKQCHVVCHMPPALLMHLTGLDPAGQYKTQAALGEQKESKRSSSPRPVFGTSTREGQAKVKAVAVSSSLACRQARDHILMPGSQHLTGGAAD